MTDEESRDLRRFALRCAGDIWASKVIGGKVSITVLKTAKAFELYLLTGRTEPEDEPKPTALPLPGRSPTWPPGTTGEGV